MLLVKEIYLITQSLPKSELFGLVSQMQRAVVAIPSNIAEGYKRGHRQEYIQFLSLANGSAAELETQLLLTKELYPETAETCDSALAILDEVLRMMYTLIKKLKSS